MSKRLAFLFAFTSMLMLMGIGVSLSFRNLWAALALLFVWVAWMGFTFALKAKWRRKNESSS